MASGSVPGDVLKADEETEITYLSLVPSLVIEAPKCREALDWYIKHLQFEEAVVFHSPKRKAGHDRPLIMYAELKKGDLRLCLSDESSYEVETAKSPATLKGTSCVLFLQCNDSDRVVDKAVEGGAKVTMKVDNQFWGSRFGKFVDPFGFEWGISSRVKGEKQDACTEVKKAQEPVAAHEQQVEAGRTIPGRAHTDSS